MREVPGGMNQLDQVQTVLVPMRSFDEIAIHSSSFELFRFTGSRRGARLVGGRLPGVQFRRPDTIELDAGRPVRGADGFGICGLELADEAAPIRREVAPHPAGAVRLE